MTFEDFLSESESTSQAFAARSRELATGAKSNEAEKMHDRAARKHQEAAAKQHQKEQHSTGY